MSIEGIPTLTLSLQGLRFSMMQALIEHHKDIQKICDEQFAAFVENGEIEKTVRQEFSTLLKATLKDALRDSVHKAIWSQDVKQVLETTVHSALLKVLNEYYPGSEPQAHEVKEV